MQGVGNEQHAGGVGENPWIDVQRGAEMVQGRRSKVKNLRGWDVRTLVGKMWGDGRGESSGFAFSYAGQVGVRPTFAVMS